MKLGWRIWLLAIVLTFSIIWIINLPGTASVMLLGLCIAIFFVLATVKSNFGRFLIAAILLVAAVFLVFQQVGAGVMIKSVGINSTAYEQGLRAGQILVSANSQPVKTLDDYSQIISAEFPTESSEYRKIEIQTQEGLHVLYINSPPDMTLKEISPTKIRLGLDLQGGSRALVKPDTPVSLAELNDLIDVTSNRLNVYGLSDLVIRSVSDLDRNNYMLIEIAGATPAELEELISQQGKFEGKVGNTSVFIGGKDIAHVERAGESAGIEGCYDIENRAVCRFRFPISLTEEAAQRHADVTSKLDVSSENPEYLSEKLYLYVDDSLMDSLFISKDLKGRVTTDISIQGSGIGATRQEALEDAQQNMKKLQTILITGSLPYKLNIVKLDTISPMLGKKFINTILLAGLAALASVSLIAFLRYRKIVLSLALLLTSFSEVIIILGIAAVIKWNLDLPAIAGIIATIGTGVDQQIVILDESRTGLVLSIKERLKRALFILLGSYSTTMFAMLPLLVAGAGLLKGFAITTMIGITTGILITRPAFAEIVKKVVD